MTAAELTAILASTGSFLTAIAAILHSMATRAQVNRARPGPAQGLNTRPGSTTQR